MKIVSIDSVLVAAIAGEDVDPAPDWNNADARRKVMGRIAYHGVSGLLVARPDLCIRWPNELVAQLREHATGQAMWELQHRAALIRLLDAFASCGIVAILLKGTAIAYDLYDEPATRSRGDSDILVARNDVPEARSVLKELGFALHMAEGLAPEGLRLQEVWTWRTGDGTEHSIDLHWAVLNSHTLANLFTEAECRKAARPLPRLCKTAVALDRPRMLIHACVHRQLHVAASYFVEDRTYYGGDRLIWFRDILLLADALSAKEWSEFLALAEEKGVLGICFDAVFLAYGHEGRPPSEAGKAVPRPARESRASTYLKGSQSRRALMDLLSVPGLSRKLAYLSAQAIPSEALIRAKYPRMQGLPAPLLHARRFLELLLPRPGHGQH